MADISEFSHEGMKEFIRPQIEEGCRLALPDGLKDLMGDISREVLRYQPKNVFKFITDYLATLMVARENLSVATRLCSEVCTSACNPELEDELRFMGLHEEDAEKAKEIIMEYFDEGKVNEQNLLLKIAKKTNIDESFFPAMQEAIRNAYKRHLINNTVIYQSSSDSDDDDVNRAAKHTIKLYRKARHTPEEYHQAAQKIQTAYRAYGVRREGIKEEESATKQEEKSPEKCLRFSGASRTDYKPCLRTVSSTSLAGSYMNLPKFVPYSVHHPLYEEDELQETENSSLFYNDNKRASFSGHKKISFQDKACVIEGQIIHCDEKAVIIEDRAIRIDEKAIDIAEETLIVDEKLDDTVEGETIHADEKTGGIVEEVILADEETANVVEDQTADVDKVNDIVEDQALHADEQPNNIDEDQAEHVNEEFDNIIEYQTVQVQETDNIVEEIIHIAEDIVNSPGREDLGNESDVKDDAYVEIGEEINVTDDGAIVEEVEEIHYEENAVVYDPNDFIQEDAKDDDDDKGDYAFVGVI